MRICIDIDTEVLKAAMESGPFRTRKEAVDAGLRLLSRRAVYRDLLVLEGQLHWDGDAELALDGEPRAGRQ